MMAYPCIGPSPPICQNSYTPQVTHQLLESFPYALQLGHTQLLTSQYSRVSFGYEILWSVS